MEKDDKTLSAEYDEKSAAEIKSDSGELPPLGPRGDAGPLFIDQLRKKVEKKFAKKGHMNLPPKNTHDKEQVLQGKESRPRDEGTKADDEIIIMQDISANKDRMLLYLAQAISAIFDSR